MKTHFVLYIILSLTLSSCQLLSKTQTKNPSYAKIKKLQTNKKWKQSLNLLNEFQKHSQDPKLLNQSFLLKARAEFYSKEYKQAYNTFMSFYQKSLDNKKADEALFFAAQSLYKASPKSPEKDQSFLKDALELLAKHQKAFKKSVYAKKRRSLKKEIQIRLDKKTFFKAQFYMRKSKKNLALNLIKKLKNKKLEKNFKKEVLALEAKVLKK